MNSHSKRWTARNFQLAALMVLLVSIFILGCSKKETTTAAEAPQKTFATPAEAGQALQTAAKAKDNDGIARILGSKGKTLVGSGDPAEDAAAVDSFAKQYERMNRWVAMTDGSRMLYIGASTIHSPFLLLKMHRRSGTSTPVQGRKNCEAAALEEMNSWRWRHAE